MKKSFNYPLKNGWAPVLAIIVAIIAIWIAVFYANQPILERHAFRQTQTALTSYWMIQEGWRLDYQTPVAGYPWAIPFEFPIFQSLVALIASLGNYQLDSVGRLLSFCFLLACAWPAFKLYNKLNLSSKVAWVFCTLLLSSPIYLFWGRTFMIETAAMFFALSALPYALELCAPQPRWRSVLFFMLFGTLGTLQKVTTALPVIMVAGFIILAAYIKNSGTKIPSWQYIVRIMMSFAVPIIAAVLWTNYTDLIKQQNAFGTALTSEALAKWNFGTIEQRFDFGIYKTIFWDRVLANNAGGIIGVILLGGALYYCERRIKAILLVSITLFALPLFIFINLHFVHDYYQTASVLFLTGALAVASVHWPAKYAMRFDISLVIVLILVISNMYHFKTGYANDITAQINSSTSTTLAVSDVIRRYTPEDSGIVVFGDDWNSETAYYAQRKTFTVPGWFKGYDSVWKEPAKFLGDKELGGLVFYASGNNPSLTQIMENPVVKNHPNLFKVRDCYIWFPDVKSIDIPGENRTVLPMDFLDSIIHSFPKVYTEVKPGFSDGSIDVINGITPAPQKVKTSGLLFVEGWLAVSAKDGIVPDDVFVTLKDSSGRIKYISTRRTPRNDVKEYFKHPAMPDVGYTTTVEVTGLKGEYVLGLAMGYKGKLQQCEQFSIPVTIGMGD